jgi:hypothetical protein
MKRYLIIGVLSLSGLLASCAVPKHVTIVVPGNDNRERELVVKEIEASRVEARVIYANKIKARSVRGRVYRIGKLDTDGWRGEIEAPVVSAPVIYAKEIEANLVIAEAIYVHELKVKD